MVVVAHLGGIPIANHYGVYAVLGFYVISGFLITAVLNETYPGRSLAFWTNRFLRIYPAYYFVAIVTAGFVFLFPNEAARFKPVWVPTSSPWDWLSQLLILPTTFDGPHFRFVPPSWSVAVELINYFLLWAFVARGRWQAALAFAIGLAYHLYCYWAGLGWQHRYYPFYAAILPFSMGALAHFALRSGFRISPISLLVSVPLWLANLVLPVIVQIKGYVIGLGLYANALLALAIVLALAPMPSTSLSARADKALGDLAYPMFLIHWLAGLCVHLARPDLGQPSPELLLWAAPVILAGSYVLARSTDALIEPIRNALRGAAQSPARTYASGADTMVAPAPLPPMGPRRNVLRLFVAAAGCHLECAPGLPKYQARQHMERTDAEHTVLADGSHGTLQHGPVGPSGGGRDGSRHARSCSGGRSHPR